MRINRTSRAARAESDAILRQIDAEKRDLLRRHRRRQRIGWSIAIMIILGMVAGVAVATPSSSQGAEFTSADRELAAHVKRLGEHGCFPDALMQGADCSECNYVERFSVPYPAHTVDSYTGGPLSSVQWPRPQGVVTYLTAQGPASVNFSDNSLGFPIPYLVQLDECDRIVILITPNGTGVIKVEDCQ